MQVLRVLEWSYNEIRTNDGTRSPSQSERVGPKEILVQCPCGTEFVASQAFVLTRKGTFFRFPMSPQIQITCATCENTCSVNISEIP